MTGYPTDPGSGPVLTLGQQSLDPHTTAALNNGILTLTAHHAVATAPGSVEIQLSGMENYADSTITVTVRYTDKEPVQLSGITVSGANKIYDGTPVSYAGQAVAVREDTQEPVTPVGYTYAWHSDTNLILDHAPVNAGSYRLVYSVSSEDPQYFGSISIPFTIQKATITVTADNVSAYVGDPKPTYSYTVSGLAQGDTLGGTVTFTDNADLSKAGTYTVTPAGAVVPNADNYNEIVYKSGTLTVMDRSSGGDGGSSSGGGSTSGGGSSSDGSSKPQVKPGETITETKPDGTKVETTKDSAGNVTTTETKKDGSSVTDVTAKNGVTSTTTVSSTGKVEAQVKVPAQVSKSAAEKQETVVLPMPPVSVAQSPTVQVELGSTREAVSVKIPVSNITPGTVPVLVHADGTREVVRKSGLDQEGVTLSLDGSATLEIVDNSKTFSDTVGHWASDSIAFVTSRELFNGTSETTFAPSSPTTRGQLMTVLARLEGADTSVDPIRQGMAWAQEMGISDGSNPSGTMSRQQLATMLWRLSGSPAASTVLTAPDAGAVADYATVSMAWAVENGILNGFADGTLNPEGTASRAHVATMLSRFVNL